MEDEIFEKIVEFTEKHEVFLKISNKFNYNGLSISEVHCIEKIQKLKNPNASNISKEMKMTRGGVAKLTAKLIKKGYIKRGSIEGNRKEVHYSLTVPGVEVYEKHEKLHEKARKRETEFISSFSREEQEVILKFMQKINTHTVKLTEDLKK